ncbi:3-oxoacyl-[acyl-carrier-protein] synthase III C-terminal domain-containing protein [Streptomyces sp. NPDC006645]|uniref:3-oxoacyl-[acyl-carrier-protein] synthase III C-terminal domain-containing protein n=1 Tax=unclassified Streptomyces TaxID=2593676 RepID=UPI0033AA63E0
MSVADGLKLVWTEVSVPEREVGVAEIGALHGLAPRQVAVLKRMHGLAAVRWDPELPLLDLLVPPARKALERAGGRRETAYLIYVHASLEAAPAQVSVARELRDALGLGRTQVFAVSQQACASTLAALEIAGELLRAEPPGARALVVNGDQPFTELNQMHYPIGDVMGEGATATVVSWDGPGDEVRGYAVRHDGSFADFLTLYEALPRRRFIDTSVDMTVKVVGEVLSQAGLTLAEVDHFIPSNISRVFWSQVVHALGVDRDRVFLDNLPRYGHCFAADSLINFETLRERGRLAPGGYSLLACPGLGASFAAMLLRHGAR